MLQCRKGGGGVRLQGAACRRHECARPQPAPAWGQGTAPQPHRLCPPRRYAGALAEVVDVDKLLRSRSLRELEETLFCATKSRPVSWETYRARNEPLRDVDEAAVPVLCVCSADDPVRGPPARTLPLELFRTNPFFFLLLSPHGGHCGFPQQGPGRCWSHGAVLDYFGAVTEFLRAEERRKGPGRGDRRRGDVAAPGAPGFSWQRAYTR
nr:protein ABHD15 [Dromaius novaehollandiae]